MVLPGAPGGKPPALSDRSEATRRRTRRFETRAKRLTEPTYSAKNPACSGYSRDLVPAAPKRLLVIVVAYHAESTLTTVLERIPSELFATYDCEILVIDDASTDRTFEIGREYKAAHPDVGLTVLRNELNQGYGGNQKIGYAYAIAEGFDAVALLHGDAQYAPEELPLLAAPIAAGDADAVFGSRMMVPGAALKGGMPLYKYVSNRILTGVQNAVLGTRLSEFHSGYRIYAVAALRKILWFAKIGSRGMNACNTATVATATFRPLADSATLRRTGSDCRSGHGRRARADLRPKRKGPSSCPGAVRQRDARTGGVSRPPRAARPHHRSRATSPRATRARPC
jgi:Glycosyl transferase family 2